MILTNNNLRIDNSTVSLGFIIATLLNNKTNTRYKLQVVKDNHLLYYEFYEDTIQIPLQFGAGVYKFQNYRNISGNRYTPCAFISINANRMDPQAYLLQSNQYVHCNEVSDILKDIPTKDTQNEQFAAIKKYMKDNYIYDYIKQVLPKKDPLPNIPDCIKKKKGICQDFASLAVALCRRFKIKASLEIGTCDGIGILKGAHAWVKVYIDNDEIIYDPTADITKKKMAKTYKLERWY